MYREGI